MPPENGRFWEDDASLPGIYKSESALDQRPKKI
jgi:hypothetical protein